ncbi:MAG: phage terminase large subunit [Bacteroidota bacterium]
MNKTYFLNYVPTPSQNLLHDSNAKYRLIGGAMGGGKSKALCVEALRQSYTIPGNRGAILRKHYTTLRRTTMVTFFQTIPPEYIREYNKTEGRVTLTNDSEILFLDADESKDPLFEKLKSLELGWFAIDEASEIPRQAFQILVSRLRWKCSTGNYFGFLASNPEQSWLKEDFIDARKPDHQYIPALPKDNPYLPPEYVQNLRAIFDEHQQRKYIDGDWTISDDPLQIIPYAALKNCIATDEELATTNGKESLGIDVAELGDDQTVFAFFREGICYEIQTFKKLRVDEVAELAKNKILECSIDADRVGVDAVGNGAGVWGNLTGAGFNVQRIIAGASQVEGKDKQNFNNLKSQMWWELRKNVLDVESGFKIPNRQSLIQDLTAVRCTVEGEKKITVESKDRLKRRIGRSTDEGDALVIANWVRTPRSSDQYHFGILR